MFCTICQRFGFGSVRETSQRHSAVGLKSNEPHAEPVETYRYPYRHPTESSRFLHHTANAVTNPDPDPDPNRTCRSVHEVWCKNWGEPPDIEMGHYPGLAPGLHCDLFSITSRTSPRGLFLDMSELGASEIIRWTCHMPRRVRVSVKSWRLQFRCDDVTLMTSFSGEFLPCDKFTMWQVHCRPRKGALLTVHLSMFRLWCKVNSKMTLAISRRCN